MKYALSVVSLLASKVFGVSGTTGAFCAFSAPEESGGVGPVRGFAGLRFFSGVFLACFTGAASGTSGSDKGAVSVFSISISAEEKVGGGNGVSSWLGIGVV